MQNVNFRYRQISEMLGMSVSGLWAADLARSPLRSRSTDCRSTLRSRSSVFWNVRSPIRSRSPDFLPAPLCFPLRSCSVHMLWWQTQLTWSFH